MSKRVMPWLNSLWLVYLFVGLWIIANNHSSDWFAGFWSASLIITLWQTFLSVREYRRKLELEQHRADLDLAVYDAQRRMGFIDKLWETLDDVDGTYVPRIEHSRGMYGDLVWEELREANRRGAEIASRSINTNSEQ